MLVLLLRGLQFLADAQRSNLDIAPKPGDVVGRLVQQMYATAPHLVALVTKALRPN